MKGLLTEVYPKHKETYKKGEHSVVFDTAIDNTLLNENFQ